LVPSNWLSVVLFLLLIAPGLLYDLLAQRRRVEAPESAFREISRVVLASLAFSGIGLLVVGGLRTLKPDSMLDTGRLLDHPQTYLVNHYRLGIRALAIQTGVALGAAALTHWHLARKHGSGLRPRSTWTKVLRDERPNGMVPFVRVKVNNGTIYIGQVAHFTADLDVADRELVLAPPLFSKRAGGPLANIPEEWQRLVLPASSIESIVVQYRALPSPRPGLPHARHDDTVG
jgi:hypothetical protein